MFVFEIAGNSYEIEWGENGFNVKCQQSSGRIFEKNILDLADNAYSKAQDNAEYMPSSGMIEFYTAAIMGVDIEPSGLEAEEGVIY